MSTATLTWVIGIICFFAVIGYWVIQNRGYNIRFILKRLTGGETKVYIFDRAKEIKKNGKVSYWYLKGKKMRVQVPPTEAIQINSKGQQVVEAYITDQQNVVYGTDKVTMAGIKKAYEEFKTINGDEPVVLSEREFLVDAYKDNQEYTKWNWFKNNSPVIVSGVILIVFLLLLAGSTKKMLAPMNEFSASMVVVAEKLEGVSQNLLTAQGYKNNTVTGRDTFWVPEINTGGVPAR